MDCEGAVDSHFFVLSAVIVRVQTRKWKQLFESFEGAAKFAEEIAKECLKTSGRGSCIPECFVGHYRVKHAPGLQHFPANRWDVLTAAPYRSAPRQSAEKTWPRFFIAARISSRDSVCFRRSFWSEWRSWRSWQWRARPI